LRRIIGGPRDEGDLRACTLTTVKLVLDVENSVTAANTLLALAVLALGVEELLAEDRPVSLLGCLLNNNLLPVVADLVDDPLNVLAELELVEGADALGCDGNTGLALLVTILEAVCAWR
jgi:ribosomal protein S12 methylthiotransferase accessory factor YcaO